MSVLDISEHPPPQRSRTWSFYLVLLFAVLPLWLSVPVAWYFTFYFIYTAQWSTYSAPWSTLFLFSCCEVIFSVYHCYLAHRVSATIPPTSGDPEDIQIAYMRLLKAGLANLPSDRGDIETIVVDRPGSPAETIVQLDRHDPRAIEFRHSLRTWFCKVPFSSITRHHIEKWLYWAMYNTALPPVDQVPETHKKAMDEALILLQKRIGCKIPEGSNDHVRPILLTVDKTNIFWRPFAFYSFIHVINWCLSKLFKTLYDVQYGYSNGVEYLVRIPAHWDRDISPRPIVFLHGLGLGLFQYHQVIASLINNFPDRPILIPLQPQISQDVFHPRFLKPPSRHEMADQLAGLLKALAWVNVDEKTFSSKVYDSEEQEVEESLVEIPERGVTMLSHSNGSYTHAWMLKGHPELIGRSCFVDPVTFCSWEGDVCYNFFYRPCMTGMELLVRYFVGSELGVANLLQRHFCWTSNSLWFEEIPNARDPHRSLFLLGGKDDIVHAERVKLYLASHGVRKNLWYDPEGRHGQALIPGGPGLREVLRWLSEDEF
ncbi:hypothetical protein BDN70DRAFT_871298 [Pholiota conissans]|uniref:Uncharacterized protein n=1 Tax=Pholiota conissans TaxID=109636 RepID=A0A9P5ZE31_9AGAR|nr:hypothetical protein BDN70DRAFT_871298 [Pholiota conissans]